MQFVHVVIVWLKSHTALACLSISPTISCFHESQQGESSCASLLTHFCLCHVQVANFVSILDKDLGDRKKTAEVDVGALLRSSYSEYFAAETDRRLKSVPVAFYSEPPTQLFPTAAKLEFPGWVC